MSASATPAPPAVDLEVDLDAPPAKVWRALTERQALDRWLLPDATGESGPSRCERIDAEPGRRVSYGLRDGERDSIVTFSISRNAAGGTRLRIVHVPQADGRAPRCSAANDNPGRLAA